MRANSTVNLVIHKPSHKPYIMQICSTDTALMFDLLASSDFWYAGETLLLFHSVAQIRQVIKLLISRVTSFTVAEAIEGFSSLGDM